MHAHIEPVGLLATFVQNILTNSKNIQESPNLPRKESWKMKLVHHPPRNLNCRPSQLCLKRRNLSTSALHHQKDFRDDRVGSVLILFILFRLDVGVVGQYQTRIDLIILMKTSFLLDQ